MGLCGSQLRVILDEILKVSISKTELKIMYLWILPNLRGDNMLMDDDMLDLGQAV